MSHPNLERSISMHGNIGLHEQYALVSPQDFVHRMEHHWTDKLGLCSSKVLKQLWLITAKTFQESIIDSIHDVRAPWRVLQPPTGSGKTQGACLYAAMQAELNASHAGSKLSVGMLIVVRLIHQAEDIARTINEHVGRDVAVAHHSDARAPEEKIYSSDVLVITHQAYVNAAERLGASQSAGWERFTTWKGGKRLITVIDEALANVVESSKVSFSSLSQVIGFIPLEIRERFPGEVKALERLRDLLGKSATQHGNGKRQNALMIWSNNAADVGFDISSIELGSLRKTLRSLNYDQFTGTDSDSLRQRMARGFDSVLEDAQAIMQRWAFYAQKGKEHTLNSSSFLIPWDVPGPVVLDATATANFLWDLFEDQARIVPVPGKARDYSNVTLHVARASGVGKGSMVGNIKTRFPRLLASLEQELDHERSVFVCVHGMRRQPPYPIQIAFNTLMLGIGVQSTVETIGLILTPP